MSEAEKIRTQALEESIFSEFLGKVVKIPYRDGRQLKVARGILESASGGFVKIRGELGTIIINERNVERMSLH